ncbi:hypothetical protein Sru01_41290 [Sphaerisporangium rufum]|uniref:TetR/AcrR family transcriptional regulator n=1 Tax=Sphaerisporangium rufum TaxID=1381558 RepID=A0A919R8E4_9ACTN|nr:TetR/AcrR family transcriptional regulator [Sphaerisporangium rufum]GII79147.1 hypothetical protein Sru01_41290 [Sphaerisporangium rufum]
MTAHLGIPLATPYSDPHARAQDARRRVLDMALAMRRHGGDEPAHPQLGGTSPARAVEMFLALLQDRLPVWLHVLDDLLHLAGRGRVDGNLLPVARAGIAYYAEVQAAAMPAFVSPAVTVRFREALREAGLGPGVEIAPLAGYLAAEQRLGRVAPDVDPAATAALLLAGCFRHAYDEAFTGAARGVSRDEAAAGIVRGLRLAPDPAVLPAG